MLYLFYDLKLKCSLGEQLKFKISQTPQSLFIMINVLKLLVKPCGIASIKGTLMQKDGKAIYPTSSFYDLLSSKL